MTGLVYAVGLTQLPMWVPSWHPIIRNVAMPSLESISKPQSADIKAIHGFSTLTIFVGVVGLVLMLALALFERKVISADLDTLENLGDAARENQSREGSLWKIGIS